MNASIRTQLVFCFLVCVGVRSLSADSIVITKAAAASTIAEIFVTENEVRVELEVGEIDLKAFRDVLFGSANSSDKNNSRFFREGFVVRADDGIPLVGKIVQAKLGHRLVRDEITGDPLPKQPMNAQKVLRLSLRYPLDSRPTRLSFTPPLRGKTSASAANIGFITYHNELPVNDFRYLSTKATLELDWKDPWYSRFRHPNLRRQFDAPISVFLYVENFEVRKEIVLRPRDFQKWLDLGLQGKKTIPVADQETLKNKIADFLAKRNPVTFDGKHIEGKLDRIHFLRRSLRKTRVIDPPEELNIDSATLGVIFVYPTEQLPQQVSMRWELFNEKISSIPGMMTDEAGGMPGLLTADDPALVWNNHLTNPTIPAMLSVATPQTPKRMILPVVSILSWIAFLFLAWCTVSDYKQNKTLKLRKIVIGISLIVVGVSTLGLAQLSLPNPLDPTQNISTQDSDAILAALLHNTYRAFDRREESLVYDRLDRSISGDLLSDVYLQTRQSIELESQGGARVKIDNVLLQSTTIDSMSDRVGFSAKCRWMVSGSVGHWGHIHQRQNAYEARFDVQPIDGHWKITTMELLDEQRLDSPSLISRK